MASRTGPDPDDHVHSAAAVAGRATVVLSADKKGYPPADITPARRRDPDALLTELLRRYPCIVVWSRIGHERTRTRQHEDRTGHREGGGGPDIGISVFTSFKAGVLIKVVSERLGHASATFTLNTYQWLLPGMQAEAAATFQRLLANPEPGEDDEQAANDGP